MTLKEWLFYTNTSQAKMAERLDCGVAHFNRIVQGSVKPSRWFACAINQVTGGQVGVEEFGYDKDCLARVQPMYSAEESEWFFRRKAIVDKEISRSQ